MKTIEERLELLEAQLDGSRLRARIAELEVEVERLQCHESELNRLKRDLGIPDGIIVAQYAINAVKNLRKLIAEVLPEAKRMPGTEDSWLDQMVHDDEWITAMSRVRSMKEVFRRGDVPGSEEEV